MIMITCDYCNVSYQTFQSLCGSCGAPLPIENNSNWTGSVDTAVYPANTPAHIIKIHQICVAYADANVFYPGTAIPQQILHIAIRSFPAFPQAEELMLFCDTTPMGSGVWGFAISLDGLYWNNNEAVTTQRNVLTWAEFAKRTIKRQKSTLELGHGDVINIAGLRNATARQKAERLLKEIRTAFNEK